jgi:HNH endonuclease/EVE domain
MAEFARAWVFQYDQTRYEIEQFIQQHGEYDWWEVTAFWNDMSVGDRVYFRRSITRAALPTSISAVGRLVSPVYKSNPPDQRYRVDLHYELRVDPTLTPADLSADPILGQKRALVPGIQGTKFALTPAEAARLDELVTPRLQPFLPHAQVIGSSLQLDERTRTLIPVVQRQGQPEFRNQLIEAYGGRCAITACDAIDALEAAHISPYLGPKTNHVTNGLLLRGDIHTLFDRGLVAIDDERMTVILHETLKLTTYRNLDGIAIHLPTSATLRPDPVAVRHHRQLSGL